MGGSLPAPGPGGGGKYVRSPHQGSAGVGS
jgi:hypothetical protein